MPALPEDLKQRIRDEFPKYPNKRAVTLPALHIVHDAQRAVSPEAIVDIADLLELHPAEVHDTMSFYQFFREPDRPLGRHRLWVCRSISCMLRGSDELIADVCERLGVHPGETTSDGNVSLEYAECLGACEGAPCVLMDEECHMDVTAESVMSIVSNETRLPSAPR